MSHEAHKTGHTAPAALRKGQAATKSTLAKEVSASLSQALRANLKRRKAGQRNVEKGQDSS